MADASTLAGTSGLEQPGVQDLVDRVGQSAQVTLSLRRTAPLRLPAL